MNEDKCFKYKKNAHYIACTVTTLKYLEIVDTTDSASVA